MNKIRKMLTLVVACVLLVTVAAPGVVQAEGDITIHVKVPSEWTSPGLWAWSAPDGTNVFASWPGEKLLADESNSGWFYYNIPSWANSVIINEGVDGGKQTTDYSVETKEMWITLTEENTEGMYEAEIVYEAPEGFGISSEVSETQEDLPKTGNKTQIIVIISLVAILGIAFIAIKVRNKKRI